MGSEQAVERLLSQAHAAAGPSAEQRLTALDRLEAGLGGSPGQPRRPRALGRTPSGAASGASGSSNHWLAACALLGAIGALGAFSVGRGTAAARLSAGVASAAAVSSAAASSVGAPRVTPSTAAPHAAGEPHRAHELLQSAQRSLLDAAPAHALTRLDELEALGPDLLIEEREATRVLAWCARGERARALEVASSLRLSHPGSAYERRLSETCVGSERSVREASSSVPN